MAGVRLDIELAHVIAREIAISSLRYFRDKVGAREDLTFRIIVGDGKLSTVVCGISKSLFQEGSGN